MLIADPRGLLTKLSAVCRRALEQASSACVTSRHYDVTVEHMLLALLDHRESDLSVLLDHCGVEAERVRAPVQRYLGELRSGNMGKPVFDPTLLEWFQDAWLYASTELGESQLRSGALLVRLALTPSRYLPFDVPVLESLPKDALRKNPSGLAAHSAEATAQPRAGNPSGAQPSPEATGGALARFTTNLTERAKLNEIDPVFARETEVRQVVDILCRRRKNNPIIVGDPGVGKTALVEGLALRITARDVPVQLRDTQVLSLDLGALQAGAGVKGEFENRLKGVLAEVKASPRPIVLFIDEAHTLIGAGGPQGGSDAANLLKPALARGEVRTIAATTWAEYKRYFEKDAALERRFQPVKVDEPSVEGAVLMLRGLAKRFEEAHGVLIQDDAVRAAVTLSSRYLSGRQLPDKAVDLLDTAAARVKVLRASPHPRLEDVRARLAGLDRQLEAYARDQQAGLPLDETLRERARAARADLTEQATALESRATEQRVLIERIDALRGEGATDNAATRENLRHALGALAAIPRDELLVHADVDEALIASVVSDWTGIPVGRMVKDDVQAILALEQRLGGRVRGQDAALAVLGRELRAARSGLKPPCTPLGVFLLVGPSGVGKTETALGLADLLFGGERFLVTINMSEFQERHTVSRLIGSPPGYVGFGEGGMLTEAVRQRPYSVVLLDEVEKADKDVLNLFYQVFDKGMLADGEGRIVDFKNTVVIMTSNLATDLLTRAADPAHPPPDLDALVTLVKPVLSAHFKPALLARMTVVPYIPIQPDALRSITRLKLEALAARARESHGIHLAIDDAVMDVIAARCSEVDSGARNIDHILRGAVLPLVSNTILTAMAAGAPARALRLHVEPTGGFACTEVSS